MATPSMPGLDLATALDRSEPLNSLMQRLRDSKARLEAIANLLPTGLQTEVRPGPLDDTTWVLLVGHAAAAAKLRQLLPTLQQQLTSLGWHGPSIKIKVLPRTP
jgi:Dna[CI] antecedent, DciA